MTIQDLIDSLGSFPHEENVVVILDEDSDEDDCAELEPGSVLDVTEVGAYVAGMRVIRVKPR